MSGMGRLAGKIALVTGGSRGLGRGIAEGFAAEGAKLVVNYLKDEKSANAVVDAIKRDGGEAISVRADIGEVEDVVATALFLATKEGAYFTGQTLCPAGGDVMV